MNTFSFVEQYGGKLFINKPIFPWTDSKLTIDCETDEQDNFVGIAVTFYNNCVHYFTSIDSSLKEILETHKLIGQNLKGDVKWLRQWGVNIPTEHLYYDTIIASYIKEPTRLHHGLKYLGKDILNMEWPSYDEMTGKMKGEKKKWTLDKLPMEYTADYCGMDCMVTSRLASWFMNHHTDNQKRIMNDIEMPINRLLFTLEQRGIKINLNRVKELDGEFLHHIEMLDVDTNDLCRNVVYLIHSDKKIRKGWEKTGATKIQDTGKINFGSWQQKKLVLHELGFKVETTDKKELVKYKENPIVANMLHYSEYQKLHGFTKSFLKEQKDGIIHATFSQLTKNERGMTTGRLSARDPNLMQIPVRTEAGNKLREVFIPREGMDLICADYSQADLRVLAHFSKEPVFTEAFMRGEDIHQATADILGLKGEEGRRQGKEVNLAYANSVGAETLSESLNIPHEDAKKILKKFNSEMLVLSRWKEEVLEKARDVQGVVALHNWFVPIQGLQSDEWKIRGYAERQAVSVLIQGGTAIIMKLAMLRLQEKCPAFKQLIQVHDEIVGELNILEDKITQLNVVTNAIKYFMESVPEAELGVTIPFIVEIGSGKNWRAAKESSKVKVC